MSSSQKGFAALEGLLILVIIAIIGGTGYYVWHSKNQADKTLNAAATSSSPSTKTTASSQASGYFTIKEWSVKAKYTDNLTLKYAVMSGSKPDAISLTSKELENSDSQCKVDLTKEGGYGGVISRYKSTDNFILSDGSDSGVTAADTASVMSAGDYAHVGDYYYFYQHPQAVCGASQDSNNIQTQTDNDVRALLSSLQATQ